MRLRLPKIMLMIALGIVFSAYMNEGGTQPLLATGADAEVTGDGLHRVDPSVMGSAWINPDLDLSGYSRIYFMPTVVQFRDVPERRHTVRSLEREDSFFVDDSKKAQLRMQFAEAFHEAIAEVESYDLSDDVGRDVLLVRGLLTDVISGDPPNVVGSAVSIIRWAWEANIILELRDSMSDEVLARTADRERIDGPFDGGTLSIVTPRVVQSWSLLLVRRLEQLRNIGSN